MVGRLITVDGNIGVGKTLFCQRLVDSLPKAVLIEETAGMSVLKALREHYYDNPKEWATDMQFTILNDKITGYSKVADLTRGGSDVIIDRSIYGDACFARVHHRLGNMSDRDWFRYQLNFKSAEECLRTPDLAIFLNAPTTVCLERIRQRGREEEMGIDLEYLNLVQDEQFDIYSYFEPRQVGRNFNWSRIPADMAEILEIVALYAAPRSFIDHLEERE